MLVQIDATQVHTSDIVLIEPTIEALYYKFRGSLVYLRIKQEHRSLFLFHPLVHDFMEEGSQDVAPIKITLESPQDRLFNSVDTFAAQGQVQLLRRQPQIFLGHTATDNDFIVVCGNDAIAESTYEKFKEKFPNKVLAVDDFISQEAFELLSSATLVVGSDGWQTQAAAALNSRVLMITSGLREKLRRPLNIMVATNTENVLEIASEILYEKRYPDYMNVGNAADFIKAKAKEYLKSNFLDIGASRWPMLNSIPVDKENREVLENANGNYAGLFSSHCLEHIVDWKSELALWHKAIREKGTMFLYLPHPRCKPWEAFTGAWVGAEHVWNPEPVMLVKHLIEELNFEILEYTARPDVLWSYHIVARKH